MDPFTIASIVMAISAPIVGGVKAKRAKRGSYDSIVDGVVQQTENYYLQPDRDWIMWTYNNPTSRALLIGSVGLFTIGLVLRK